MGSAARPASAYDGRSAAELATLLDVPEVSLFAVLGSTQDVAHAMAADGAAAGTLVLADAQQEGRGRMGRRWESDAGSGIWLTLVERPTDPEALDVLSIRVGLQMAAALDHLGGDGIRLKWPNDLYRGAGKVGGVLIEARWRDARLDWLAVGVGLNIKTPVAAVGGVGLGHDMRRVEVLAAVVPAIRRAVRATGYLASAEMEAFARRDLASGRRATAPVAGIVAGIDSRGALLVDTPTGRVPVRSGSLLLKEAS